jgi:16S rRNA (adenine1518-N6/adenine1519-N6)-dimethyltransferase
MLINNLKNSKLLTNISEEKIRDALAGAGIDGKRRGETLSVEEFGKLNNLLYEAMTNL